MKNNNKSFFNKYIKNPLLVTLFFCTIYITYHLSAFIFGCLLLRYISKSFQRENANIKTQQSITHKDLKNLRNGVNSVIKVLYSNSEKFDECNKVIDECNKVIKYVNAAKLKGSTNTNLYEKKYRSCIWSIYKITNKNKITNKITIKELKTDSNTEEIDNKIIEINKALQSAVY